MTGRCDNLIEIHNRVIIAPFASHESKVDIVNRLKKSLNSDETFLKLFAKMWGGSGLSYAVF